MKRKIIHLALLVLTLAAAILIAALFNGKGISDETVEVSNDFAASEKNPTISEALNPENVSDTIEETVVVEEEITLAENGAEDEKEIVKIETYPWHKNITVTFFWAGEEAGSDNKNISNIQSAWDVKWVKHFGGVDDPKKRNGFFPAKFVPKENPFYFALPYNDFDKSGKRKKEIFELADWAKERKWRDDESVLKNQWIEIGKEDKKAYAQWQDVGPFKEDDKDYVFGSSAPKSKINKSAGLDVSPAVRDYLDLKDIDKVDWRFISENDVPDGPWKKTVTKSQIYWN